VLCGGVVALMHQGVSYVHSAAAAAAAACISATAARAVCMTVSTRCPADALRCTTLRAGAASL
jgi:hypothetical protein